MEIKSTGWEEFCQRFNDSFQGTLVSLEKISPPGITTFLARDLPLKRLEFAKTTGCIDVITLHLSGPADRTFEQSIIDPIHVWVRENPAGAKVLEVQAENGIFHLTFHSGKLGMLLDGLT